MKSKPEFKTFGAGLQDLFACEDGTVVRTADDWRRRREELKRSLQAHCYGTMPPAPAAPPRVVQVQPPLGVRGAPSASLSRHVTHPFADSDYGLLFDVYMPAGDSAQTFPCWPCRRAASRSSMRWSVSGLRQAVARPSG